MGTGRKSFWNENSWHTRSTETIHLPDDPMTLKDLRDISVSPDRTEWNILEKAADANG